MPKGPVIAACVLAIVLALVMVLTRPGSGEGAGGPVVLVPIPPSEVASIGVGADSVRYEPAVGRWVVEIGGVLWPADDGRARGGLRLFGRLSGTPAEATGNENWTRSVVVKAHDGRAWDVSFGPPAVGGTGLVRVESPDGTVTTALVDAGVVSVGLAGIDAWRDERALPLGGARPSRVEMVGGGAQVGLQSGPLGWSLVAPVRARASADAVAALVGSLGSLTLASADPDETPAQAAVAVAIARENGRTLAWQLEILGESGLDGTRTRVRASGSLFEADGSAALAFGPLYGTVDRDAVAKLVVAPEPYLALTALSGSAGDVGVVHVTAPVWEGDAPAPDPSVALREGVVRLRKRDGAWSVEGATGEWDNRVGPRLARLVTESKADRCTLTQPAGFEPVALVQPAGTDGVPFGAVAVGLRMVEGQADAWVLISADGDAAVYRVYPLSPATAEIDAALIHLLQVGAATEAALQPAG